ncbi:lipoprotein [Geobacter sp. SVR]|nr:lipoprotein [Geobacter sp. SVR]GCF83745.1 lipoprotein [Geobacter sp. SVR]
MTVALFLLPGCDGGGSGVPATTGSLQVGLTDKQSSQFQQVVVSIREVRLVPAGAEDAADNDPRLQVLVSYGAPHAVDLVALHLQQEILNSVILPAGTYSQIRLILEPNPSGQTLPLQNFAVAKASPTVRIPLNLPGGQQAGLRVAGEFRVQAGLGNSILIDFDPTTAIVPHSNGALSLDPAGIRIVQTAVPLTSFGSLSGRVVASFRDWSSAIVSVVPQDSASASATGAIFSNLSGNRWVGPFSMFASSGIYRVHVRASRFAPYSTPPLTVVSGVETPVGDLLLIPSH